MSCLGFFYIYLFIHYDHLRKVLTKHFLLHYFFCLLSHVIISNNSCVYITDLDTLQGLKKKIEINHTENDTYLFFQLYEFYVLDEQLLKET